MEWYGDCGISQLEIIVDHLGVNCIQFLFIPTFFKDLFVLFLMECEYRVY